MIVVDVGCARYGEEYSLERLIDEFRPSLLYGFDPAGNGGYGYGEPVINGVPCVIEEKAAWIRNGTVRFAFQDSAGHIDDQADDPVGCIDLAEFIGGLPKDESVVVKMDCEGAEYQLLEHLIHTSVDTRLQLAWVEWHPRTFDPNGERQAAIRKNCCCEIRDWHW